MKQVICQGIENLPKALEGATKVFLVCDSMILELMERMGQTSDEMFDRHADLE